jgi:nucleotide-binding universal stress UspA family protein
MSLRKILVPVFGNRRDQVALESAFRIAKEFGAHVDALFVRPNPTIALPYGYLSGDVSGYAAQYAIDAAVKAADAAQNTAQETFAKCVDKAGMNASPEDRHARLIVMQADFVDEIERKSRLCDLVVFGGAPGELERIAIQEGFEAALLSGSRPVLFAPHGGTVGQRIALAYDGSAAAAHAVAAAMPFLKRAQEVHAFEVTAERSNALSELRDYLALYGLKLVEHHIEPDAHSVGDTLIRGAQSARCDLVVMGGYGHSRLREFVFGGVTRHVLAQKTSLAILMAH